MGFQELLDRIGKHETFGVAAALQAVIDDDVLIPRILHPVRNHEVRDFPYFFQ